MKRFVRGDIDGFFGLALDNLVQLLLIDALCRFVLGFDTDLVRGRILPGVAVSLLVGNLYYAREALKLAARTGRSDVCALPYGINTVSLFAHVFLIMLPAKLAAEAAGHENPASVAWAFGLVATLGSGLIELGGAFVAERIRKVVPRAALLSTLSGIALGFISLGFLFRTFAHPLVGLVPLAVVLLTYFGRVRFRFGIPGGLVAVALGTALAWSTGLAPTVASEASLGFYPPLLSLGELASALTSKDVVGYASVIVPMGLFNLIGSLQNIESAEAAGDAYKTEPALAINGLGTLAAAAFGSCFPTTIYIGHPGWKALGARAGYSTLNALFFVGVALTGSLSALAWAIPVDAGMAIVLWIGIVITAQAFQATKPAHAPAVVVGLLPGVAAWGALMAKTGLRAAGMGTVERPFTPELVPVFERFDTFISGAFALEQGFIFTAMLLSGLTVEVIERRFDRAGWWALVLAALAALGLIHSFAWTPGDTVLNLRPAWDWALSYVGVAAVLFSARFTTIPREVGQEDR